MPEETRANYPLPNDQPSDGQENQPLTTPDPRSALLSSLPEETRLAAVAGEIRTLSNEPLGGVTLHIGSHTARTDDTGRFFLASLSPGHHALLIDGRTASTPGRLYGVFEVGIDVRAGRTHVLPYTIWMPAIDSAHAVSIPSPTPAEVVVTTPHIPGWELHLPPGSIVRAPDGEAVTQITITPLPVDRPPFPLPFGAEFPMYFTIQPGGAHIEPYGARITYPNLTNDPPGTRVNFWSYDAEVKGWHIYGRGTVTPDGTQVMPDERVAIYKLTGASISPFHTAPASGDEDDDGDPVDLGTGLFVFRKTDLLLPDIMPIALTRTHRPGFALQGVRPFGVGSAHLYEMFLTHSPPFAAIDLTLPDGGRLHYPRVSPGTGSENAVFEHTATPSVCFKSRITRTNAAWQLTLRDGTSYTFSDAAVPLLQSLADRHGNRISLARSQADHGKITRITSPHGRWLELTLDADDIGGTVTRARDHTGRVVTYDYDDRRRLIRVTDPAGGVTEYTYDVADRMRTLKDARGITFLTNEYDDSGRVIKQTRADGSTYQFAYTVDANGKIIQTLVTDPRGAVRRVTFNAAGYMLSDTRALGTPEEQITIYEREPGTNLVLSLTDPLNRRTSHTYDALGNVTSVTHLAGTPEAVTTEFAYEPTFAQVAGVTDVLGHTTAFAYDETGNLTTVTDALGHSTTVTYNLHGQPVSITDALGNVAHLTYDLGILSGMTDPLGATTTRYIDSAGRLLSLTDPLSQAAIYAYDTHNRLTRATDALGGVTEFSYDQNGNLLSVTDARGSITSYTYDAMDRLVTRTDPLGHPESYEYDEAANPTSVTDRKGQMTRFSYDALNRLTWVTYADSSTTAYTYDAGNRLTHVVDSVSGMVILSYDNLDHLTEVSTPQGTVFYTSDAGGRRTRMTVKGHPPTTYTYDDVNRLTGIEQGATAVAIQYDATGRLTQLTLPGEVVVEFASDPASQLTRITYKRTQGPLGVLTYKYDPSGNRVMMAGSFARTAIPGPIALFAYDAANRLVQRETTGLTHDANGNLTSDGVRAYTWDVRNRLASLSGPGLAASFAYDAFGRRISKTINALTVESLYDALNIVQEISGGTPVANLLAGLGIDEYLVRGDVNAARTLLVDALGSTLGLIDGNGLLQTEYTYEPFGATIATGEASPNPFQYTRREHDTTGLYYYRARYYSPTLQRFISEDPRGFAGGDLNLYAYALNNPTTFTDPLGLAVNAETLLDCLSRIQDARERMDQIDTSGRKDIDQLGDTIEEVLRTVGEMILCLSPVPFIAAATRRGGRRPPPPPGGGGPNRTPGTIPEDPWDRARREAERRITRERHNNEAWDRFLRRRRGR
jgi:RHS repeat-associated protein